ncbi:MAG TPA: LysR substrate-binding domain-containing protein [Acidimicrobiales bacterium]|nr:LysR substrate-binding domain-containing protein [Acidimicrobiales bacterium]
MDIRRLTIFLAVVDEGGFTAAAAALGMSQPAVSQAVRELERELSTELFHRLGRGVRLTPAGEALVAPARRALRDLAAGRAAVDEVVGGRAGRLDLACLPTLAVDPVAPLVGAFRRSFPEVTVVLAAPEDAAELAELVRSGRCEVGITEAEAAAGLVAHGLAAQDFLVAAPPGAPLASPVALAGLAGRPLVAAPPGSSTRRLVDEAFARAGVRPSIAVEAAQREALLPLIAAGAGTGVLPRPLAEVAARLGCVVATPDPPIVRRVALVQRDAPLTPAARRFLELALGRLPASATARRRAQRFGEPGP